MARFMDILEEVRNELLNEASASPTMLADIAGLEHYIAESYSSRAFIELLQNSDDAQACRVAFVRGENWVICANSGNDFTLNDFRSLCRSASSNKKRGQGIGYRGIGFKSVVGIAEEVHLISAELRATFSRELTRRTLGLQDSPVPLVRIPHRLALSNPETLHEIDRLISDGYTTIFALQGINQSQIDDEFDRFDSDHLIFLKNVTSVRTLNKTEESYECHREPLAGGSVLVQTISPRSSESWRIESAEDISIAFSVDGDQVVPLKPSEAIVHAFLPTLEQSGIGVRINGDFSTDPSRTRVVLDQSTDTRINLVAKLVGERIVEAFRSTDDHASALLKCLKPNVDEVALRFQSKSFKSSLVSKLFDRLEAIRDEFASGPSWLNPDDARALGQIIGKTTIPSPNVELSSVSEMARFAGVKSVSPRSVLDAAEAGLISRRGCAELVAFVAKSVVPTELSFADLLKSHIWEVDSGLVDIQGALNSGSRITDVFIADLVESGLEISKLEARIGKFYPDCVAILPTTQLEQAIIPVETQEKATHADDLFTPVSREFEPQREGVLGNQSKWRSAETSVFYLLSELGFDVEDHSRQNVGYDLLAVKDSERFFVEVKSLSYAGQPFALTPNEDSCARESGNKYVLALVLKTELETNVQFIRNPKEGLRFVKQCRQWAWECIEYNFSAQHSIPNS
ncbi:DUF3883 domain-containing protein [Rhodococcus zopfii]|uniref:DUF3883 domain-containing protein n=1 Tax=Rhodococcus zopfii TaxID=43772 RepID=A0ABU3WRG9_9NOCA|nr:DUF3883 domain-containing protein [Rhodococcus zopfii]